MEKSISTSKRAQVWSLDLMVAGVIITIGVIVLYIYAINYTNQSQKNLEELFYQGNLAAELILSEESFGILTNDRVNQTKLDEFNSSYEGKKNVMRTKKEFYFNMTDMEITGYGPAYYVGNMSATPPESAVKITRITVYKDKPTKFELYIWE